MGYLPDLPELATYDVGKGRELGKIGIALQGRKKRRTPRRAAKR